MFFCCDGGGGPIILELDVAEVFYQTDGLLLLSVPTPLVVVKADKRGQEERWKE